MRFASTNPSSKAKNPLSPQGIEIVSNAPELCYLTQIVIRLFENTSKEIDDPKRFRIEIFFSPGATATPLHMSEYEKDKDTSRSHTEPLQLISRPDLSCKELEEYIHEAIEEGKVDDDDDDDATTSIVDHNSELKIPLSPTPPQNVELIPVAGDTVTNGGERIKFVSFADNSAHSTLGEIEDEIEADIDPVICEDEIVMVDCNEEVEKDDEDKNKDNKDDKSETKYNDEEDTSGGDDEKLKKMTVVLARQYFWTSVAAMSFMLGIGCLILSREIVESDFKTRRWTKR